MTWVILGCSVFSVPLLMILKDDYPRLDVDESIIPSVRSSTCSHLGSHASLTCSNIESSEEDNEKEAQR